MFTSNILSPGDWNTSIARVINGCNSVLQTSLRESTRAHNIAQASLSFPATPSPSSDTLSNLVTKLWVVS